MTQYISILALSSLFLVGWDRPASAGAFGIDSCHKKCRRNVKKGMLTLSCMVQIPQCYRCVRLVCAVCPEIKVQ